MLHPFACFFKPPHLYGAGAGFALLLMTFVMGLEYMKKTSHRGTEARRKINHEQTRTQEFHTEDTEEEGKP